MSDSESDAPPLARLLAIGFRMLIDGLHERLQADGWTDVRPAFGFVLLAARNEPTTSTDMAALMGITKQAASKLMASMMAAGYLQQCAGTPTDGRQRPLELTRRGRRLLTAVEGIYDQLEAEWADVIGTTAVERLRRDLDRVARTSNDGELPPVRPTW